MKKQKVTDYHDFTTIDTPQDERRRLNIGDIWRNEAKCGLCGDIIRSLNRHDFRTCKCGSMSVDGGSWYARRVGNLLNIEEMVEMYNDIKEGEYGNTD